MRLDVLVLAIIATRATAGSVSFLDSNSGCDDGYVICAPPGATSATTPQIGDADFQNLFVDIVESSLPASKRSLSERQAGASLCCNELLSCLTITALGLPMCYDKFTTNYFLPDGSHGTVVGGNYNSSTGDSANLETGDYTLANGQTGNIYSNDPAAKPNTATLPMPSQFTASGVGSAVPISSLGIPVTLTYTTTLPASIVPATTISPSTVSGAVASETILIPTTISTQVAGSTVTSVLSITSVSPSTEPPSTIRGTTLPASTASALTTVVTTTEILAASVSSTPSSSSTKKSDATRCKGAAGSICLVAFLVVLFIREP